MKLIIKFCLLILIGNLVIAEMCPEQAFHPVCASDNMVHANRCEVKKSNLKIVQWFDCKCENNICTEQYDPVCGNDGNIYGNRCELLTVTCSSKGKITEVPKAHCCNCPNCDKNERCNDFCSQKPTIENSQNTDNCKSSCDEKVEPICLNGHWHLNKCHYDCILKEDVQTHVTIDVATNEKICSGCDYMCITLYDPVCGSDGKTSKLYGNSCELARAHCLNPKIHEVPMKKCEKLKCPQY